MNVFKFFIFSLCYVKKVTLVSKSSENFYNIQCMYQEEIGNESWFINEELDDDNCVKKMITI